MKRTLLDEGVPIGLVDRLGHDDVHHVNELGWTGIRDDQLIANAVAAKFGILVLTDQNIPHQQNIRALPFGLVVVCTTDWSIIERHVADIKAAIAEVKVGAYARCLLPPRRGARGGRGRRR